VDVREGDEADPGELWFSIKMTSYEHGTYHDVFVEAKSALPGLVDAEWEPVPADENHTDPCWWTVVDTSWMSLYRQAVENQGVEAFVTAPPDLRGGSDGFSHVVPEGLLTDSIIASKSIRALCGYVFVPSRDPDNHPMCLVCAQIFVEFERILQETLTQPDD
jgi:hypothetical protein